jgi:orotate phosphoribosyltransferase
VPARYGHFLLESGYHTDSWLNLDVLFLKPRRVAPLVTALAARIQPFEPTVVCGPLVGGAFLAQAIAHQLGLDFYFAERVDSAEPSGLFQARYRLPTGIPQQILGQRVAVVDDAISAGSSVRATIDALSAAGARTVVVGTLLLTGTIGRDHLAGLGIPVEALEQRELTLWEPSSCPLCQAGKPLENPV